MTTINLPGFDGVNDIAAAARNALAIMKREETKGANAVWPVVRWVAQRAGQMIAQGSLKMQTDSGELLAWVQDRASENRKAFITAMQNDSGVSEQLDKDASKKQRDERRANMIRMQRAAELFLAFMVLSDRYGIGPDYSKERVPAVWYVPTDKHGDPTHNLTKRDAMTAFTARAEVARFHATPADDPDGNGDMIALRPNAQSTMSIAYPPAHKGADQQGSNASGPDVSDASVKSAADVLASRLARDGGAPTGDAADALESVYAAIVANDATWSLLVALRTAHERAVSSDNTAAA